MSMRLPGVETSRLRALRRYAILDTETERIYDDIVNLAARVCGTPMAAITFVDRDRVWMKAALGLEARQLPRENAFCSYAIGNLSDITLVSDTCQHPRFARHPMVLGEPYIRFYAGVPLLSNSRDALGNLCVLDVKPNQLDDLQRDTFRFLATQVMSQLELRRSCLTRHTASLGTTRAPESQWGGIDYGSPNVTSTKEWVERCVAHLLHLDPGLDPAASIASVQELSVQRQWRLRRPEAAAEELFEQTHHGTGMDD